MISAGKERDGEGTVGSGQVTGSSSMEQAHGQGPGQSCCGSGNSIA